MLNGTIGLADTLKTRRRVLHRFDSQAILNKSAASGIGFDGEMAKHRPTSDHCDNSFQCGQ